MATTAGAFEDLWVWEDARSRLPWYFEVATNRKPAKYLISRRVPVAVDLDAADEDTLWAEHEAATERFLDLWQAVRQEGLDITARDEASPNLVDLSVELTQRLLTHCDLCRWHCGVDRTDPDGKRGTCQLGTRSRLGSFFHHRGEELVFRGTHGSGTLFFTSCNQRCSFCQNGRISQDKDNGQVYTPRELAMAAWLLRMEGCHNINWVGGEVAIHLHNIVEAISHLGWFDPTDQELARVHRSKADGRYRRSREHADHKGLFNTPILWNSNFFLSEETLRILRPLVDVWLPDLKFGPGECAVDLSRTPWYWETVTGNIETIHGWGEDLVVRHLIMSNHVACCTEPVIDWLAEHTPDVLVNVMDQYHPDSKADPRSGAFDPTYEEIARYPKAHEIRQAYDRAEEQGLAWEEISLE